MIGEICSLLARLKYHTSDDFQALLVRGRMVLMRVVYATDNDKSETFMVQQARLDLDNIDLMDGNIEDGYAEVMAGELTDLETILCHDTSEVPVSNATTPLPLIRSPDAESESAASSQRLAAGDSRHLATARSCCTLL